MRELSVGSARIELVQGDITQQDTEAVVNAANRTLLGGGGVDGAIHAAGGPTILEECRRLGGCRTGDAKVTSGGKLKASYVVHAVGPVYHGGEQGEADLLASVYRRSLEVAAAQGVRSIAFPSISTGAYGYPVSAAAAIAIRTVVTFLRTHPGMDLVRLVLFSAADLAAYEGALAAAAPPGQAG
jgi:O-acetyl-ADP-ribose deacetylase (regulator of RNase III)